MLNKNPELDVLEKETEFSQKTFSPNKKRKSAVGLVLKITFIYFPLGVIVAAFALPFFIGCGSLNKVKQSEAKQYVSSMNRAQQAHFGEKGTLAHSVDELQLGIKTQTTHFRYSVSATKTAAFSYGIPYQNDIKLKSYVGAVFLDTNNRTKKTSSLAIMCVTKSPTKTKPANPIFNNGAPICGDATEEANK